MRYLLDTNVVSEWSKELPFAAVVDWVHRPQPTDLAVSAMTLAEARYGIEILPPGRKTNLLWRWYHEDFIYLIEHRIIPLDQDVARHWATLRAQSRRVGRTLAFADSLILSTAVIHGMVVVTRNVKDFSGLGAEILNPWQQ